MEVNTGKGQGIYLDVSGENQLTLSGLLWKGGKKQNYVKASFRNNGHERFSDHVLLKNGERATLGGLDNNGDGKADATNSTRCARCAA